ncbi:MAG: sugar ABC transporter permease, partial [Roseitalea sp.]|nr:sugar ABC transporter permease [Roseitalea sp.]
MTDTAIDKIAQRTPTRVARKVRGLSDRAIAWL